MKKAIRMCQSSSNYRATTPFYPKQIPSQVELLIVALIIPYKGNISDGGTIIHPGIYIYIWRALGFVRFKRQ